LVRLAEKRERRFTPMTATRMDADGRLKEECERVLDVWFEGVKVGHHRVDIVVENKLIVEIEAVERLRVYPR